MKTVRKVIIPAAGLGTRFLPATKAMPKEMLPVVDTPAIQFIVQEAIDSGIEDILIVTGRGKRAIEDHFDRAGELEAALAARGKVDLLQKVQASSAVDIHYIRQKEPLGLGHAIWCARHFIGDEPFGVMLGDDIVRSEVPCLRQLIAQFERTGASVVGAMTVPAADVSRYGILDPIPGDERLLQVRRFVEKPAPAEAPSRLAIIGRYVFTPDLFRFLADQRAGAGGEVQLTDAIERLNAVQRVYAWPFDGRRYDVGTPLGFLETILDFALERDDLRGAVAALIKDKARGLERRG